MATKNESGADWPKAQWYRARQPVFSDAALLVIDEAQYVPVGHRVSASFIG